MTTRVYQCAACGESGASGASFVADIARLPHRAEAGVLARRLIEIVGDEHVVPSFLRP